VITPQIERWLEDAGYQYHCFISYPRIRNDDLMECAMRIKEAIEAELALVLFNPKVFLDKSITGGADWRNHLRTALCRSISMVALCAPIYYHPAHRRCGLEWAAMWHLEGERLRSADDHAIIPLIFRGPNNVPEAVSRIQHIDISRVTTLGRRYYNTQEFRTKIGEVTDRIISTALRIACNQASTKCEEFNFPATSAFHGYQPVSPSAPFRSSTP
jgi:TIR domain